MKLWAFMAVCWLGTVKGIGTNMSLKAKTTKTLCLICALNTATNDTEKKYSKIRFPGRSSSTYPQLPSGLYLGLDPVTHVQLRTKREVLGAACKTLKAFQGPAYFAYFDEANRKDSNADLTTTFKRLSHQLNATMIEAQDLYQMLFQAPAPRPNFTTNRQLLQQNVTDYKNRFMDTANVTDLQTYAIVNDLGDALYSTLGRFRGIKQFFSIMKSCQSCQDYS